MMPVMGLAILESIELLGVVRQGVRRFLRLEMEANRDACEKQVE